MAKINYPIAITLSLFLFLILFAGLTFPKYQNLRELSRRIELEEIELKNQQKYFQSLVEISEKLKDYQSELAKINSALPSDPSLSSLLNFLEKASSQTGLVLKGIGSATFVASTTKTEGLRETSLGIVVAGSYPSFKNFLSVLEKSARFIQIESLSFSTEEKPETPINFNLRIKIYSY